MSVQSERKYVNWSKDENMVATLVIDNPPMNVLSGAVCTELKQCVEEIAADPGVVAVVVTGAGERAFMAGADIKEFPQMMTPGGAKAGAERIHAALNALDFLPKPTIAAIHGYALGGGLELALACDIRVAGEEAQLGVPEIKLGLFPGGGGTQRLPRLIGEGKAKLLMFTGDPVKADEALRIGLVDRVVPKGEDVKVAQELAKTIASRAGVSLGLIKQAVDRGTQVTLEQGLELERELFDKVFQTEDVREGVDAFINKRPAKFKHR